MTRWLQYAEAWAAPACLIAQIVANPSPANGAWQRPERFAVFPANNDMNGWANE